MTWFGRSNRAPVAEDSQPEHFAESTLRRSSNLITDFRDTLVKRVRSANQTTAQELSEAARHVKETVEVARLYVELSQKALGRLQGQGDDSLGQLLGSQASFLRNHARDMSERAALQDERARQAAASAKSIADLAASIDRLAGEARLLAVNARIESSRLGAQSAGFEVLASEMQRLSDEVASTNERVGELAGRLGQDLPWIAQHARDFRQAMDTFANTTGMQLDDTERGIGELRLLVSNVARSGGSVMEDILRCSRSALSHLEFREVVAHELRQLDGVAQKAQIDALEMLGASQEVTNEVPPAVESGATDLDAVAGISGGADVALF